MSVDPPETNAALEKRLEIDFPIVSDSDLAALDAFGVRHEVGDSPGGGSVIARPAVFLLDEEGRILWKDLTDNWRVRVRPETVLAELAHSLQ